MYYKKSISLIQSWATLVSKYVVKELFIEINDNDGFHISPDFAIHMFSTN